MGEGRPPTRREPARTAKKPEPQPNRFTSGFATLRDVVLFLLGSAIIIHEVWLTETAEAAVIAVGVALCGAPLVLGADERKAKG